MKNLSKDERLTIVVLSLYTLASVMSNTFVNVYLYTYTSDLASMCLYTAIRISMFPFFFTIAGKIAQRKGYSFTLVIGLVGFIAELSCVLSLNQYFATNPSLIYLIALICGISEGFLWLSFNSLQQYASDPSTRTSFLSEVGIYGNIANIIAPIVTSFMIDMSPSDNAGYVTIFKVVLVVYILLAILGYRIKTRCPNRNFSVLKDLNSSKKKDPKWHFALWLTFVYGLRDSMVLMLTGLLIYDAVGSSGGLYSRFLALFAILAILAHLFCRKYLKRSNRLLFFNVSAIFVASATIILAFCSNTFGALYFGIVNAIAGSIYGNVYSIITMNIISNYAEKENLTGRVIAKETYLSAGRVGGMMFAFALSLILPTNYLVVSVTILSLMPIVLILYADHYYKTRDLEAKHV